MVKGIYPSLVIPAEVCGDYAGKTMYTLDPSLGTYCHTLEEVMEWFYSSPEPLPLLYSPDMLVIFACTFAGRDQVAQANQMHFTVRYGELINVEPYQILRPQGEQGYWTVTDTYPELVQVEII